MSQPKSAVSTFDTDWAKIRGWAKSNNISETAVNNVYTLDSERMQSGYYEMSNAERTRAVLAAAGMDAPTQLPSDKPSPTDLWGNTVNNVTSIALGLMPTRLASNIWDTLKNTAKDIEDPDKAGGLGDILTDTALSWLPGAYDLGQVIKAGSLSKGLATLAENPVTSVIDVMPYLKALDMGAGAAIASGSAREAAQVGGTEAATAALGKTLAKRLGIEPAAMARMGAVKIAAARLGQVQLGSAMDFVRDSETGEVSVQRMTLSQRYDRLMTHFGMGRPLRKAAGTLYDATSRATQEAKVKEKGLLQAASKLTPDQLSDLNDYLSSGRSAESLLNDSQIPTPIQAWVKEYIPWEQWHEKYMIDSGMAVQVHLPDGTTAIYESSSPVLKHVQKANDAIAKANKAAEPVDKLLDQADQADAYFAPKASRLGELRNTIGRSLTSPQADALPGPLRDALGKLAGRNGLLDTMSSALQSKDWAAFTQAARKARDTLASRSVEGMETPTLAEVRGLLNESVDYGRSRVRLDRQAKAAWQKAEPKSLKAEQAQRDFMDAVRKNPPAPYRDAIVNRFMENFLASADAEERLDKAAAGLKKSGHDPTIVDRIRADPVRMTQLVQALFSDTLGEDPFLPEMISPREAKAYMDDALNEADLMRARGETPLWVPTLSPEAATSEYLKGSNVYVNPTRFRPTVTSSFKKSLDASNTVHDAMLGVSKATKDALGRDATISFMQEIIAPMLKSGTELKRALARDPRHLAQVETETAGGVSAVLRSIIHDDYGYKPVDVSELTGLDQSEFGLDPNETYFMPADYFDKLGTLVNHYQFPLSSVWDKTTGVFKFSILGLSPRYTAHVMFGGGLMLALRSSPHVLETLAPAARAVWAYHHGNSVEDTVPEQIFRGASTVIGSPDRTFHYFGGRQMGGFTIQEWLNNHGINWKVAKGADVIRAAADINFRFTNYIADMQQAIAYLDGSWSAARRGRFHDPVTGEVKEMTGEQMRFEGMQHAEAVMGNLNKMTPLERSVARKIMPFYGWTKHILKYVATYPFDHPWRASFLTTLATQNTDNFSSGLDERMQLLLFLGQPNAQGDVNTIDVRALDPFRDVANYATFSGWISSMNPIIVAPAAMIDPQIIYGSNVLYPNMSYSDVYGTKIADPAGNVMTALEQEVPQVTVLDDALGLSAQARQIRSEGGGEYAKSIFEALGIPGEPQELNLQQIAASHEIDRYEQAEQDATDAWQTGDFSTLNKYPGTVPDPLNPDYDITPKELEQQYYAALKRYPTLPPSETVPDLPSPAV